MLESVTATRQRHDLIAQERREKRDGWWQVIVRAVLRRERRRGWVGYTITIAAVVLALGFTLLMQETTKAQSLLALLLAVIVSSWYGGARAGVLAMTIGALAAPYFLIGDRMSYGVESYGDLWRLLLFVACSLASIGIIQRLQVAERQAGQALDEVRVINRHLHGALAKSVQSDARFRLAADASRLGTWEWDISDGIVWSESMERIYGFEPGTYPRTFEELVQHVHPDDRELLTRSVEHAIKTGEEMDIEHRMLLADGGVRWLNGRGKLVLDEHGKPSRMLGIGIDITDRKRDEAERERLVEDLRKANAAKDEFLGLVSHELKTPITTIYGNAEVLRDPRGTIDEDAKSSAINDISLESQRLHSIVDNLLVLARLEQGQQLDTEPILLHRLVERVVRDELRRGAGREINFQAEGDVTPVLAQPTYLEQIVRNLLSNAMKYSDDGTPIDICVERREDELQLQVLDRGVGLPSGDPERVFEPFYRAPETAAQAQGVGIGLSVCKRLIEAQSGYMWARDREGGGADIGFALPITLEDATEE